MVALSFAVLAARMLRREKVVVVGGGNTVRFTSDHFSTSAELCFSASYLEGDQQRRRRRLTMVIGEFNILDDETG